jgi:hypothetical protein
MRLKILVILLISITLSCKNENFQKYPKEIEENRLQIQFDSAKWMMYNLLCSEKMVVDNASKGIDTTCLSMPVILDYLVETDSTYTLVLRFKPKYSNQSIDHYPIEVGLRTTEPTIDVVISKKNKQITFIEFRENLVRWDVEKVQSIISDSAHYREFVKKINLNQSILDDWLLIELTKRNIINDQ